MRAKLLQLNRLQAQQMMTDEAAPKYQALDDALQKLIRHLRLLKE